MRRYIIVSGILFILPITDFAVAAPVVVRGKLQADADVAHTGKPEYAITSFWKRGNEWSGVVDVLRKPAGEWTDDKKSPKPIPEVPEGSSPVSSLYSEPPPNLMEGDNLYKLWLEQFSHSESDFPAKPESLAVPPSSGSQALGPAGAPMDVEDQMSSQDHAPPSLLADDHLYNLWLEQFRHPESDVSAKPEESSAEHPSSSSQTSIGPAGGPTDVKKPLASGDEEPLQASTPGNAPLNLLKGDDLYELWLEQFGHTESDVSAKPEPSVAHPPSTSEPLGPAGGTVNVEKPAPPIDEGQLQVFSQDNAPPNLLADDNLYKLWLEQFGHPEGDVSEKPDASSTSHPLTSSQTLGPVRGTTGASVEKPSPPIDEGPLQVSSQDHAPPNLLADDNLYKLWLEQFGHTEIDVSAQPEESSVAHPPSTSEPLGPAGGPVNVEKPAPPFDKGPLQVSSQDHALPNLLADDNLYKLWLEQFGHPEGDVSAKPEVSSAPRSLTSSQTLGPAVGTTDASVDKPPPPIDEEPLQVSSQDDAPPNLLADDNLYKLWLEQFGHPEGDVSAKPEGPSAAPPSSSSQALGPAGESADVQPPLPSIDDSGESPPAPISRPATPAK